MSTVSIIERSSTLTGALAGAVLSVAAAGMPQARPSHLAVVRMDGSTPVAVEAPKQSPRPERLQTIPVTHLDDRAGGLLDGPPAVSLAAPSPLPIREALRLLVSGTQFGVVISDDVEGTFAGDLKSMSLRQAVEAVLFPRHLEYDVAGPLIRVFPRRTRTRLFDVNFLNVRRTWQRGVRHAVAVPGGRGVSTLESASESDAFDDLLRGIVALLSQTGRAHVDRRTGVVQVTDFADRLDLVGVYVEAVQVRASRQVRLQARVFEITLKDPSATTIDWSALVERVGGGMRALGPSAGLRVADADALTRGLAEQGDVRTIAAPLVVAMNNEPAVMRAGTEGVYFVAASSLDDNGRARERTMRPESVLEGLTLTVTPQIAADGIVQLNVASTYSEKTGEVKSPGGGFAPVLSVAESDSVMRLRGGETVVISGLLKDRLRARPATAWSGLFAGRPTERVKSELVVLLTATVVTPGLPGISATR